MARFTSIGMGKKTFVASSAEDRQTGEKQRSSRPDETADAGPSNAQPKTKSKSKPRRGKKRTRDGTAKEKTEGEQSNGEKLAASEEGGHTEPKSKAWGRDEAAASEFLFLSPTSKDRTDVWKKGQR